MKKLLVLVIILLISFNGVAEFIELEEEEVWSYYSPEKSLEHPSNELNIVANETVKEKLYDSGWRKAEGAERYAYFNNTEDSKWKTSDTQLEKGNYHGNRYHIRLYRSPWSNYTVGQAHYEHFNWLTVRHEVTSNDRTAEKILDDLKSLSSTQVIALGLTASFMFNKKPIFILGLFPILILGVRSLGIALSELSLHPYSITLPLYLLLTGGTLLAAYHSKIIESRRKRGLIVFTGLLIGFSIDLVYTTGIPLTEAVEKLVFTLNTTIIALNADKPGWKRLVSIALYLSWLIILLLGFT